MWYLGSEWSPKAISSPKVGQCKAKTFSRRTDNAEQLVHCRDIFVFFFRHGAGSGVGEIGECSATRTRRANAKHLWKNGCLRAPEHCSKKNCVTAGHRNRLSYSVLSKHCTSPLLIESSIIISQSSPPHKPRSSSSRTRPSFIL